jgi:hypothetical protein
MKSAMPRRRLAGTPSRSTVASAAPGNPNRAEPLNAALVEAVVVTATVAVAAEVPLTVSEAGIVQDGRSFGLLMLVVTAHERFTSPVNPLDGVMVTVAVLPVVAPAWMLTGPLLANANDPLPAPDPRVTVTFTAVVAEILPVVASVPVTVTTYEPAVVAAVVFTANAADAEAVPVILTVAGSVQVAGLLAPVGALVTAQERLIKPTNPLLGATVI